MKKVDISCYADEFGCMKFDVKVGDHLQEDVSNLLQALTRAKLSLDNAKRIYLNYVTHCETWGFFEDVPVD